MAPQDNAYTKYLRTNSNLSNLADAYKVVRDWQNEYESRGLKGRPLSNEEKFAQAQFESAYHGPAISADVTPPPPTTVTPQPATDIEGGFKVSRPADAPFRVSTAVRRAKSAAGTLENQQPRAGDAGGSPGASGGGLGGSGGGRIPTGGGALGGGGATLEDHIAATLETARANGSLATAESVASSGTSVTRGLQMPPKSAVIGTGIVGLTSAAIAIAEGAPPLETLAKAGVDTAVFAGATGLLTAVGVPAPISLALGTIASAEADKLIGKLFGDDKAQQKQQVAQVAIQPPAFQGGQCPGVIYDVIYDRKVYIHGNTPVDRFLERNNVKLVGPISIAIENQTLIIKCARFINYVGYNTYTLPDGSTAIIVGPAEPFGNYDNGVKISYISVNREDGRADICGNPGPMPMPGTQPQPTINNVTNIYQSPPSADLGKQDKFRLTPLGDRPLEQAKRQPQTVAIAPPSPFTITPPGWTIPGFPDGGTVTQNPNGTTTLQPADGGQGYTLASPGKGPVTISIPGMQPITLNPDGTSDGTNPNVFNPTQLTPTPLKSTPLTSNPLVPTPTTPNQPTTTPTTPDTTYQEILKQLQLIGLGLGTLGVVGKGITDKLAQNNNTVQQIAQQTTPDNLSSAAANGTCKTLQPGGCMSKLANNADQAAQNSAANKNLLSNLGNNLANLAELDLLAPMNGKLDGIGSALNAFRKAFDQFTDWIKLDRILNILGLLTSIHNAFFLSQAVEVTLVQMVQDWIQVFSPDFFKTPNGDTTLNQIIDKFVEDMAERIVGKERLKKYEELFKALSRIYSSAAQVVFAFQMIGFSILNALNTIGSWHASVYNALKKYGVVGHNAYAWLNPQPNFHNTLFTKFSEGVGAAVSIISGIDLVAQSILQGRNSIDEMTKEKQKIDTEMKEAKDLAGPVENDLLKQIGVKTETDSKGVPPTEQTIRNTQQQ